MNGTAAGSPTSVEPLDRLESWKEIATYLKRGVTTVQRWEREEGLPVRRHQHDSLGSVYAFKHELEAWRARRDDALLARSGEPPTWKWTFLYAGALLAAVGIGAASVFLSTPTTPRHVRRLTIVPSNTAPIVTNGLDRNLAITPDGSRIVYVGGSGAPRLFVRALDRTDSTPIAGVVSPRYPFVSPDGQWVGFFEGFTSLKKVALAGGVATELIHVESAGDAGPRGADWGPSNQIAFAVGDRLLQVSADGGPPQVLATADHSKGEAAYWWPKFLPGGHALLFTIVPSGDWSEKGSRGSIENAQVAVLDLRTGKRKILFQGGSHAQYLETGHLIYAADGTLRAVAFDLDNLAVVGTSKTVLPEVEMSRGGAADFDVARDGTLVYTPGTVQNDLVTLMWVDRTGREEAVGAPPFSYRYPQLSPDASRVALGSPRDLGVWDVAGRKLSWFGIGPTTYPIWSPNGQRLFFASTRAGAANIYQQVVNGSEPTSRLTESPHNQFPNAVSPDGRYLVFREDTASSNLMLLDVNGKHRAEPLIQTPFDDRNADFSPDGQLLAYQSNESGQVEVYVQPFPNVPPRRWKVSSGGGTRPKWASKGNELFYVTPAGAIVTVPIQRQAGTFTVGPATMLFDGDFYFASGVGGRNYDVSSDGQRFLMMKPVSVSGVATSGRNIEVVLNWSDELIRLVPTH